MHRSAPQYPATVVRDPGRTLLVGCGALGTALGLRLVADGGRVTAIRRSPDGLPSSFDAIADDLRRAGRRTLPACDSVVITLPPRSDADVDPLYPSALAALAEALPARPSRVVFVSSTRVLEGWAGPERITEAASARPLGDRARELRDAEELAARFWGAQTVRPAGIYGPGRESLVRRVRAGVPVDYTRRTNRIHEDDLVALLYSMVTREDVPPIVHAVDDRPVPLGEVVTFLASVLGVAPPPHAEHEPGGGTVLDGSLMRGFSGPLRFPTFREGYAAILGHDAP